MTVAVWDLESGNLVDRFGKLSDAVATVARWRREDGDSSIEHLAIAALDQLGHLQEVASGDLLLKLVGLWERWPDSALWTPLGKNAEIASFLDTRRGAPFHSWLAKD